MSKSIKAATVTGALLIGLMAHTGVAQAQRWDGWHGFGWGGGGFQGAILPGVGWAGRWGGRGGYGRPAGWGTSLGAGATTAQTCLPLRRGMVGAEAGPATPTRVMATAISAAGCGPIGAGEASG